MFQINEHVLYMIKIDHLIFLIVSFHWIINFDQYFHCVMMQYNNQLMMMDLVMQYEDGFENDMVMS
jgi:hypothetical protein